MKEVVVGWMLALGAGAAGAQQVDPYPLPPKDWPAPVMDSEPLTFLLLDRLEYRAKPRTDAWAWEAQGWWGGYTHKLWFKTEGEGGIRGPAERGDVQALYARRISPYWHAQVGVRQDARPEPSRTTGVLALEGLAPYWFEIDASAFLGNGLSGRLEAQFDQLLTQRWILQPRIETSFAGSSDPARGIGSGVTDLELGLRLRYEIRRELAPYVGVSWTRQFGGTAGFARAAGHDPSETAWVLGVRLWY